MARRVGNVNVQGLQKIEIGQFLLGTDKRHATNTHLYVNAVHIIVVLLLGVILKGNGNQKCDYLI